MRNPDLDLHRWAAALAFVMALATGPVHAEPEIGSDSNPTTAAPPAAVSPTPSPSTPVAVEGLSLPAHDDGPTFVSGMRDRASDMVMTAMNFLGVRYRRGGNSVDSGFDCSGFTRHVFETSLGLLLPRRADEQAGAEGMLRIGREELKPGDLVFFNTLRRTFSHVGIYVGEGKFIHSPSVGGEVRVDSLSLAYWEKRYTGARRLEPALSEAAAVLEAPLPIAVAAAVPQRIVESSMRTVAFSARAVAPRRSTALPPRRRAAAHR